MLSARSRPKSLRQSWSTPTELDADYHHSTHGPASQEAGFFCEWLAYSPAKPHVGRGRRRTANGEFVNQSVVVLLDGNGGGACDRSFPQISDCPKEQASGTP